MFKILLIDDEEPIRQAIKIMGSWETLGIASILEANEGAAGLKILREEKPDIVLVDMKMPIMNGMDFLETASKEFPEVKYIIVSGYDDFEYTKHAIKTQVLDYILKPISGTELNNALMQATGMLKNEREANRKRIFHNIDGNLSSPIVKEKVFTSIIRESGKIRFLDDYKRIIGFNDKEFLYGVVILELVNFDKVCREKFAGDGNSLIFACSNAINELCQGWSKCFAFRNDRVEHEIIIILGIDPDIGGGIEEFCLCSLKSALDSIEELFGILSFASVGEFHPDIGFLNGSFRTAETILYSVNLLNNLNKVYIKPEITEKQLRPSLFEKRELLMRAFESGSLDCAKSIINDYFQSIKLKGYFSIEDIRKIVSEFILMIDNLLSNLGIKKNEEISLIIDDAFINTPLTRFDDFRELIINVISRLFKIIKSSMKTVEKNYVYEIKDYIDKNYFTGINLNLFSERYYISKEYLSKLFKDEFGYGIYEYVLKTRMEKAKEMMEDENIKIKTISDTLGYSDNNYFSKAFKNYYGISPTDYKASKSR